MIEDLKRRAESGDIRAQAEWGARLLVGREAPYAPQEGMRLVGTALAKEDPWALQFAAVLAALGHGRRQDWGEALALVRRAAALGDARAQAQLGLLGDGFDIAAWTRAAAASAHRTSPRVATAEGFIAPSWCAWLIEKARPQLSAARVKNPVAGGANTDSYRSNTGMGLSVIDTDLVIQLIHARIAATLGLAVTQQEPTNILHYEVGEQYQPHFDYVDPGVAHFQRELMQIGQRVATFLIYLNDDYEGGETAFPRLDWRFKGKTGDALMFWNVDTQGRPDPKTLHAGTAPTRGEKWLFSKWVRSKAAPLL
jgi:predicted 2-oxoglutarate/Fe(II)-dependent dioxygenase YbiX